MAERKSDCEGLNVLLGVSGGIAAYKAVDLASKLTAAGAAVQTIMTENACHFVGTKSFEAVTGLPVFTTMWNGPEDYKIGHIKLSDWADIIVVAPATANIIAKIANGICDDLLSTTLCACWQKPVLVVPAMNVNMWNSPAVQKNVECIRKIGFKIIGPQPGRLACGAEGIGRMAEPQQILAEIITLTDKSRKKRASPKHQ
jgi:phosphopantothenoylcysteine decarboxylase/phosphopantothenate--cysteine ligase